MTTVVGKIGYVTVEYKNCGLSETEEAKELLNTDDLIPSLLVEYPHAFAIGDESHAWVLENITNPYLLAHGRFRRNVDDPSIYSILVLFKESKDAVRFKLIWK